MSAGTKLQGCMSVLVWLLLVFICAMVLISMESCKSVQYVPVETVRTEYVTKHDSLISRDTIIDRSEVVVREVDSATMAQYGIQLKDMQRAWIIESNRLQKQIHDLLQTKADTVIVRDTIQVPVPVEHKLTKAEQHYITIGKWVVGAVAGLLLVLVFYIFTRRWRFSS